MWYLKYKSFLFFVQCVFPSHNIDRTYYRSVITCNCSLQKFFLIFLSWSSSLSRGIMCVIGHFFYQFSPRKAIISKRRNGLLAEKGNDATLERIRNIILNRKQEVNFCSCSNDRGGVWTGWYANLSTLIKFFDRCESFEREYVTWNFLTCNLVSVSFWDIQDRHQDCHRLFTHPKAWKSFEIT